MPDGYADMSRDELIKLIAYLTGRLEESDAGSKADSRRMSEMANKACCRKGCACPVRP